MSDDTKYPGALNKLSCNYENAELELGIQKGIKNNPEHEKIVLQLGHPLLVKISDIKIRNRFRKDFGNVSSLVSNIRKYGKLLQPIGISESYELIYGRRRIEAYKILGKSEIEAIMLTVNSPVEAEADENIFRKNFTIDEISAIDEYFRKKEEEEARQRQKLGKEQPSGNFPKGRSREIIASKLGISDRTLEKIRFIKDAKDKEPKYRSYWQKVNSQRLSIDKAYRIIQLEEMRENARKEALQGFNPNDFDSSFIIQSDSGNCVVFLTKPKGLKLSDEQMEDLKRQLSEQERLPDYWWLNENDRMKELQKGKEYEEYESNLRNAGKLQFEKELVSKREIINWLSPVDDSARFHVRLSFQTKFPFRNRPSRPPMPPLHLYDDSYGCISWKM